jgi:hypothetical protein
MNKTTFTITTKMSHLAVISSLIPFCSLATKSLKKCITKILEAIIAMAVFRLSNTIHTKTQLI